MGLLDMIIGYVFCTQIWGLLWCVPRRGVFVPPNSGSVVQRSSQGRFPFVGALSQKMLDLVNNCYFWSRFFEKR